MPTKVRFSQDDSDKDYWLKESITAKLTCASGVRLATLCRAHDRKASSGAFCYAISRSVFPIIGMSAQMHYCKDEYLALLDTVDNSIGEAVYKAASKIFF